MKARFDTYCLHSLQEQFFGFHFLIPLKIFRLAPKVQYPRLSDLGRKHFRFRENRLYVWHCKIGITS